MDEIRRDRFAWTGEDGDVPTIVTNDSLQCCDCVFRTEPRVMQCMKYLEKPGYVINHTMDCKYYKKKAMP